MKRLIGTVLAGIALGATAPAYSGATAPVVFPTSGTWQGARYEATGAVKAADGRVIATVRATGGGALGDVDISVCDDCLRIDAARAFAKGLRGVVLETSVLPGFDAYAGKDVAFSTIVRGRRGMRCRSEVLGRIADGGGGKGWYVFDNGPGWRIDGWRTEKKDYVTLGDLKPGTSELRFRFTVEEQGEGAIELYGLRFGTVKELGVKTRHDYPPQKLLFRAAFDGTADAETPGGTVKPLCAHGLEFVDGRHGKAVRVSSKAKARLDYPFKGIVLPEQGSFAAWYKYEGDPASTAWRNLFSFGKVDEKERLGTGVKRAGWLRGTLRVDPSDDLDSYRMFEQAGQDGEWHHIVVTWSPGGVWAFVDGCGSWRGDSGGVLYSSLTPVHSLSFSRPADVDSFSIGGCAGARTFEGLIDDVEIFAAPMSPDEMRDYYFAHGGELPKCPDYKAIFDGRGTNPHESRPSDSAPGEPGMELVQEVRLDSLAPCARFRAVGTCAVRELDGVKYLEGGGAYEDRFAVGFTLDPSHPVYAFEIDYPDDAVRTMGVTIQDARHPYRDYRMQCGVMTGREYPNTGRMLTHRVLWWTCGGKDVAVMLRQAASSPQGVRGAAAAAVRVYRVKDGRLPAARIDDAPKAGGWNRTLALYFEDPAISQDFLRPDSRAWSPEGWCELLDKLAATMKFTGQNLFAYPAAWYQGMLGVEHDYRIDGRAHPPYFWKAVYEKFDREGLYAMPTLNQHNPTRRPKGVTYESRIDGSLHSSPVSIFSTGRPNGKHSHGCPPNFNIAHPEMQALVEGEIDGLVDVGAPHPSFKGVCLHLSRHSMHWFSTDEGGFAGGYNDYCIDAFEKAKGVKVPVSRTDPMRGRAYYEWIRDNAHEKWVEWRCDVVSGFYLRMAEKMKRRRPDLKLWINMEWTLNTKFIGLRDPDFFARSNREGGIDARRFRGANVILSQTCAPADTRWGGSHGLRGEDKEYLGRLWKERPFFDLMRDGSYPAINIHERYFESPVGRMERKGSPRALTCDWMDEIQWRVETINPAGRHALAQFVGPLAVQDVLCISKGGYLMGNYGTERELVRFARYFRALPAIVFEDVASEGPVRVRRGDFQGRRYLYVANTSGFDTRATVDFGEGMDDLVTGERLAGRIEMDMPPWEFRSFANTENRKNKK